MKRTGHNAFTAAARRAREECLKNAMVRGQWRRDLQRAMMYVRSFVDTTLASLANGRQCEFRFLIRHLDAYKERYGDT